MLRTGILLAPSLLLFQVGSLDTIALLCDLRLSVMALLRHNMQIYALLCTAFSHISASLSLCALQRYVITTQVTRAHMTEISSFALITRIF